MLLLVASPIANAFVWQNIPDANAVDDCQQGHTDNVDAQYLGKADDVVTIAWHLKSAQPLMCPIIS